VILNSVPWRHGIKYVYSIITFAWRQESKKKCDFRDGNQEIVIDL